MKAQGKCLCGAVSMTAEIENENFGVCHCGMCRKWGGGPLFCTSQASNVKFKGGENITLYDSSDWAQRAFCKKCGTHLFYKMKKGEFMNFSLGFIDDNEAYKFRTEIYIDRKPGHYEFANKTNKLTEAQVLEQFGQ